MGSFLRSITADFKPVEPCLNVYELDTREPCIKIDSNGSPWFLGFHSYDLDESGEIKFSNDVPKVLFADVPVVLHTPYGFSLAPKDRASEKTGPESGDW